MSEKPAQPDVDEATRAVAEMAFDLAVNTFRAALDDKWCCSPDCSGGCRVADPVNPFRRSSTVISEPDAPKSGAYQPNRGGEVTLFIGKLEDLPTDGNLGSFSLDDVCTCSALPTAHLRKLHTV